MKKLLLALSIGMVAFSTQASDMDNKDDMDKMEVRTSTCDAHPKYSSWKDTKITSDIHQALNTFILNLPPKSKLKRVNEVRVLNDDGRYIAFEVELDDGSFWYGVIHHNPRGDYLVDSRPREGKLCQ